MSPLSKLLLLAVLAALLIVGLAADSEDNSEKKERPSVHELLNITEDTDWRNRKWTTDEIKILSRDAMERLWVEGDRYPHITDQSKKVWWMQGEDYDKYIYDPKKGYIGAGPNGDKKWFIFFINHNKHRCNKIRPALEDLANHFNGSIQFAVFSSRLDEEVALAYDVYTCPRAFFIDEFGMAVGFDHISPKLNTTSIYLEEAHHARSPLRFPVPARATGWFALHWGYIRKDVRMWYRQHYKWKIEPYLEKWNIHFFVEVNQDPNFDKYDQLIIQKYVDRQIIFIILAILFILETILDFIWKKCCSNARFRVKKNKKYVKTSQEETQEEEGDPEEVRDMRE